MTNLQDTILLEQSQGKAINICWFLFDVAVINSFILYGLSPAVGRKKTMKEFCVELAMQMIGSYDSRKYNTGDVHIKRSVEEQSEWRYPITPWNAQEEDADFALRGLRPHGCVKSAS